MSSTPHPDHAAFAVQCAVITVSDTRTAMTDRSGQAIQHFLCAAGHEVVAYTVLKDEPDEIIFQVKHLNRSGYVDAIILNGGTGIAPRDTTYDAIEALLDKTLPGFGELFRWLSYEDIGSRAIASRATAGTYQGSLIFSLPGSLNAVTLALEKLILPELRHLVTQLKQPG